MLRKICGLQRTQGVSLDATLGCTDNFAARCLRWQVFLRNDHETIFGVPPRIKTSSVAAVEPPTRAPPRSHGCVLAILPPLFEFTA